MPGRENQRDHILAVAADKFIDGGYHATSIHQIAQVAGVSNAAIYYHFKGGKRDLLQCVIELAQVDLQAPLKSLDQAASLHDLILRYGEAIRHIWRGRVHRTIRWMICEMPHLTPDEEATFYVPLLGFQANITRAVQRFVPDPAEANEIGWLLLCTSFGYRQIFYDLEVESTVDLNVTTLFKHIVAGFPSA